MTELFTCSEREQTGPLSFRHAFALKPIAFSRNGVLRRMTWTLGASGDPDMPLGVDEGMLVKLDPRIAGKSPLWEVRGADRSKMARFALLNANNVAAQKVSANEYVYPNALNGADLAFVYGGHKISADLRLRAGHPGVVSWRMSEQVGFDPARMMLGDLTIRQPVLLPPEGKMDAASVPLVWAVSQESGRYRLDCALPPGDWAGWTLDPTLTLQPDAAAGEDTTLQKEVPDVNNGAATTIDGLMSAAPTYPRRGVFRFDVSSIPSSMTVTSAIFSWMCRANHGAGQVNIHRMTQAWTELGATWNKYDGVNVWATPGGDYNITVQGSVNPASYVNGTFYDFAITALVQGWVNGSIANIGFLGKRSVETGTSTGIPGNSSDHATAAWRPRLVIDYTLPAAGRVGIYSRRPTISLPGGGVSIRPQSEVEL